MTKAVKAAVERRVRVTRIFLEWRLRMKSKERREKNMSLGAGLIYTSCDCSVYFRIDWDALIYEIEKMQPKVVSPPTYERENWFSPLVKYRVNHWLLHSTFLFFYSKKMHLRIPINQ